MKWIKRKPSLRVHVMVLLACAGILLMSARVISDWYPDYRSKLENWVQPAVSRYPAGQFPPVFRARDRFVEEYWVFGRPGQYLVLVQADLNELNPPQRPLVMEMIYVGGTYQSGLWAPTRSFRATLLGERVQVYTGYTGGRHNPSMEGILKIQAVVVASEGLDPRLATVQQITDERIIWSGYVINALCVIAMLGLVWSLAWTPRQVRHLVRRKRYHRGLCPLCKYDVSATPDQCPECGWGHEDEASEG